MGKKKGKTQSKFVLDCSLAVCWFFEDENDGYAESVEDSLTTAEAVVPVLWRLEVANALVIGERRKRATEAKVTAFLGILNSLPITTDDETATRAWQESINLARKYNLTVYDATYLELGIRLGLPLASLDDKLKSAAKAAGVALYEP